MMSTIRLISELKELLGPKEKAKKLLWRSRALLGYRFLINFILPWVSFLIIVLVYN